jgi:hypothetical protein
VQFSSQDVDATTITEQQNDAPGAEPLAMAASATSEISTASTDVVFIDNSVELQAPAPVQPEVNATPEENAPSQPAPSPSPAPTAPVAATSAPATSESTGGFRAPNDPRTAPKPVAALQIVTQTPVVPMSQALDTSQPAPVSVAASNHQRPANDPRAARLIALNKSSEVQPEEMSQQG